MKKLFAVFLLSFVVCALSHAQSVVNIRSFGAACTGTIGTDDQPGITAAIASLGGNPGVIYTPAGACILAEKVPNLSGLSNVVFAGDGQGVSVWRSMVSPSVPTTGDSVFLQCASCSNVLIRGMTFDMNGVLTTAANTDAIAFIFGSGIEFRDSEIINGTRDGLVFNGSSNFNVHNNFFSLTGTPTGAYQNEAIYSSIGGGAIQGGTFKDNVAVGWGTLFSGNDLKISGNTISGWGYGSGISVNNDGGTNRPVITGNTTYGGVGLDVNNTMPNGIETWAPYSIVTANQSYSNAGAGIAYGGVYSVITGNIAVNNGTYNNRGDGIATVGQPGIAPVAGAVVVGNILGDTGTGHQQYGYAETPGYAFSNIRTDNSYFGNVVSPTMFSFADIESQYLGAVYEGSVTATPGTIAAGSSYGVAVTLAGASMGDFVIGSATSTLSGATISGYVAGTNSVILIVANNSGGPITIGPTVFRVHDLGHR